MEKYGIYWKLLESYRFKLESKYLKVEKCWSFAAKTDVWLTATGVSG